MTGNPDSGGIWAPQLSYSDGQFRLFTPMSKSWTAVGRTATIIWSRVTRSTAIGRSRIFLNSSGFDPSLFHDDDGKKYLVNMVWDHRAGRHNFYGIALQEFSYEQRKLIGEARIIFKGTDVKLTEAPHIYKINGWYYLLTAEGGTKYEHQSTIARSAPSKDRTRCILTTR